MKDTFFEKIKELHTKIGIIQGKGDLLDQLKADGALSLEQVIKYRENILKESFTSEQAKEVHNENL